MTLYCLFKIQILINVIVFIKTDKVITVSFIFLF